MKELTIETKVIKCSTSELSEKERQLVNLAIKATENSYAPYSKFHVGAALRLENGVEIVGANQENAAFPVTLCAERTAIFAAQAQHPAQPILEIAIAAANEHGLVDNPISPCGSCRQVMIEIEQRYGKPLKVYLYGKQGVYIIDSAKDLLPLCFVTDSMK